MNNERFRGKFGLKGLFTKEWVDFGPQAMFDTEGIPV